MADAVSTQNIWPNYAASNVQAAAAKSKDTSLGKDDFLKILVTQLQNQDPMQPLEDKEFIAQMAQFTSVEQLTNMSNELSQLRQSLGFVSGLIGKQVSWISTDATGAQVSKKGTVEAITIKDGGQFAKVGGEEVSLDNLTTIENPGS